MKRFGMATAFFIFITSLAAGAPVHKLAENGSAEALQSHLQQNPDAVNKRMSGAKTPLMIGAAFNNPDALQVIIDAGAAVGAIDNRGWTALFFAARHGRSDNVKVLLQNGADEDTTDVHDRTPLMIGAYRGDFATVKTLVEAGAKVSVEDEHSRTPVLYAAASKTDRTDKSRYLIQQGAAMSHKDRWGRNGFDYISNSRPPAPPKSEQEKATNLSKKGNKDVQSPTDVFVQKNETDETTQFFFDLTAPEVEGAKPLSEFFRVLFRFGSIILKFALGIIALWKAGEIGYYGSERIKDFGFVALAFLLYFMLPYIYKLAQRLGDSFT